MLNGGNEIQRTTADMASPWFDTKAAANYLTASPKTLAVWRSTGRGPRYHIAGGRLVRYHVNDLDEFVFGTTKEGGKDYVRILL